MKFKSKGEALAHYRQCGCNYNMTEIEIMILKGWIQCDQSPD